MLRRIRAKQGIATTHDSLSHFHISVIAVSFDGKFTHFPAIRRGCSAVATRRDDHLPHSQLAIYIVIIATAGDYYLTVPGVVAARDADADAALRRNGPTASTGQFS